jgi:lysyl-tRNA synthetase class 2
MLKCNTNLQNLLAWITLVKNHNKTVFACYAPNCLFVNYHYLCWLKKQIIMQLSEQEIIRREKLDTLRNLGINPYPANLFPVDHTSKQVKDDFSEGKKVVIAGRIMSVRIQGKASFAEIQDSEGRIQVYVNRDEICPGEDKTLYNEVFKKLIDLGDFVGIKGELFITQVGEKSIRVHELSLLSKTLRPLPMPKTDADGNVFDSFTDPELRYR